MNFSEKIKKIREIKKITQQDLAEALEVSFATVNRWEQGHTIPKENIQIKIDNYCINNDIIIDEEDNKNLFLGIKLISASQLQNWFSEEQRLSQGLFPELIEKLTIESSSTPLKKVIFPSKDKVCLSGFDGEVVGIEKNNYFIPYGNSVWELGATTIDSNGKIKGDYTKRTEKTSIEQRKETTFILVTPKSFSYNKKQKLKEKISNDSWKEVRIYDGVVLEQWLSQCLSTSIWLFGKFTGRKLNIQSFSNAYSNLESKTNPKLASKLFTTERENETFKLISLCEESDIIKVSGPSLEESYGFVLSTIFETNNKNLQSRLIVCNDIGSLFEADSLTNNKIFLLAAPMESSNFNLKNKCILLFGNKTYNQNVDIKLVTRPQNCIFDVLQNDMNIPQNKLSILQHKAKNNIMLIIRELSSKGNLEINNWLKDPELIRLLPILLVGKINLKNKSDINIISNFIDENVSFDEYIRYLSTWKDRDNSPITFYADIIKVSLKEELWSSISNMITPNIIIKLKELILSIFRHSNPKFDLPIDKQIAHQLYGKNWEFNKYIIEGLLDSCILLTIYNNQQQEMNSLFISIFENIKTKEDLLTLSEYLLSFAELAPDEFLVFFEKKIKNNDNIIMSIFDSTNAPALFSGGHEYCNLIWSLELLLKFNSSKIRACNLLVLLYLKNFNYTLTNSPKDSLINNLHWINNSNALTFDEKNKIIVKYINNYKSSFFDIPINLISKSNIMLSNVTPKWKSQNFSEESITFGMINDRNRLIVSEILKVNEPNNLIIIEQLINLHFYVTQDCLKIISEYIIKNYNKNSSLGTKLYELLITKRYEFVKYNNEQEEVNTKTFFDDLIIHLTPTDLLENSLVYFKNFGYNCPIIESIDENYEIEKNKTNNFQTNLFVTLYKKYKSDLFFDKLINSIPDNSLAAYFISSQQLKDEDLNIIKEASIKYKKYNFLLNFLICKNEQLYLDFVNKLPTNILEEIIPIICNFKIVPNCITKDTRLTELFYKHREYCDEFEEKDIYLIKKYNPLSFLRRVLYSKKTENWDINEIVDTLKNVTESNIYSSNDYYTIKMVLEKIENDYFSEDILQLEIRFLNIYHHNELPNGIKSYLYNNPSEYIVLLTSPLKNNDSFVQLWYKIYNNMEFPKNFNAEPAKIKNFINTLMNYSNQDKKKVSLIRSSLGCILARSFRSNEKEFIPNNLKIVLEELDNIDVNNGVIIGYENLRGIRTITDGSPELKISEKLENEALQNDLSFPQAAQILRTLSKYRKYDAESDKFERMVLDDLL